MKDYTIDEQGYNVTVEGIDYGLKYTEFTDTCVRVVAYKGDDENAEVTLTLEDGEAFFEKLCAARGLRVKKIGDFNPALTVCFAQTYGEPSAPVDVTVWQWQGKHAFGFALMSGGRILVESFEDDLVPELYPTHTMDSDCVQWLIKKAEGVNDGVG